MFEKTRRRLEEQGSIVPAGGRSGTVPHGMPESPRLPAAPRWL